MKEYKVITWKIGLTRNNERLEDTLNKHAREGWCVKDINDSTYRIVFERNKNRSL